MLVREFDKRKLERAVGRNCNIFLSISFYELKEGEKIRPAKNANAHLKTGGAELELCINCVKVCL